MICSDSSPRMARALLSFVCESAHACVCEHRGVLARLCEHVCVCVCMCLIECLRVSEYMCLSAEPVC